MAKFVPALSGLIATTYIIGCQGAGSSEPDNDFEVAQPVPMGLLDPEFLSNQSGRLQQSGASKDYSQQATNEEECLAKIDPFDTGLYDLGEEPSANRLYRDVTPSNLCVATDIMSVPGYAGGEMIQLLNSIQTMSAALFGANGFFPADFKTHFVTNLYRLRTSGHELTAPSFAEVVVVSIGKEATATAEAERKHYRVNLYYPATDPKEGEPTKFSLNTTFEFSPFLDDERFGDINLTHFEWIPDSIYGQHLKAAYNTKTQKFDVVFGRSPIDPKIPAKTTLSWTNEDDILSIRGAYLWRNDKSSRVEQKIELPSFYSPIDNDLVVFESSTRVGDSADDALTVQRMAFVPSVGGKLATETIDDSIWSRAKSGYFGQISKLMVQLIRSESINSSCPTLKTTLINALTAAGKSVPTEISALTEDNFCDSNSAVTDQDVETTLLATCRLIDIIQILNLDYSGSLVTRRVSLCTKLAEGLYLDNPQLLYTATDSETQNRFRTPATIWTTGHPPSTIGPLLDQTELNENAEYSFLNSKLVEAAASIDLTIFADLEWPPPASQNLGYFASAKGSLSN